MPVPSLRFSFRRLAILSVLIGIGVAVWLLFVREDGGASRSAAESRGAGAGEFRSDDPLVRKMTVEEQAAQVLMLGFEGTGADAPGVAELTGSGVGAVLVSTQNWPGLDAGQKLVAALKAGDDVQPIVATTQEGGIYRALPDLPPEARELDIGREGSVDAAREWAEGTSQALANAGFDLNLFPVADVATLDSPVAGRAFSDDPADVTALTGAALEGCDEAKIACAPLHFPGLGAASQDPAEGPATVSAPLETLESRDLVPFRAVSGSAPAMVVSLGLYPDFDAAVPGALTPELVTGLLRDDVGFRGVAISGDLSSGAVQGYLSTDEAAVEALAAGIDLLQVSDPGDVSKLTRAIAGAVKSEELEAERLAQAAERVLDLKRDLGLVDE